ncbi:hypothetical protein V1273_002193 [Bradyrhizobium sp. AZCC 1721]
MDTPEQEELNDRRNFLISAGRQVCSRNSSSHYLIAVYFFDIRRNRGFGQRPVEG